MTAASDDPEDTTARHRRPGRPRWDRRRNSGWRSASRPGRRRSNRTSIRDLESDLDEDDTDQAGSDWAWVQEWRLSDEPPAWSAGVAIAVFAMLVVASAVFVLSVGLGDMPWLAVAANVVVAAGLAPALWLCRSLPVLRFLAGGAAVGIVIGWIAALMN